jgi:hypothetical protein
MAGADKTAAALLDKLAALDPAQRREVAEGLRKFARPPPTCPTLGAPPTRWGCWPAFLIRADQGCPVGIVKLSEVGAVANPISLMRHI